MASITIIASQVKIKSIKDSNKLTQTGAESISVYLLVCFMTFLIRSKKTFLKRWKEINIWFQLTYKYLPTIIMSFQNPEILVDVLDSLLHEQNRLFFSTFETRHFDDRVWLSSKVVNVDHWCSTRLGTNFWTFFS